MDQDTQRSGIHDSILSVRRRPRQRPPIEVATGCVPPWKTRRLMTGGRFEWLKSGRNSGTNRFRTVEWHGSPKV